MEVVYNARVQSAIFRTKTQWYAEGEKSSRYFFNLERSRYRAKNITKLNVNNKICTENKDILNEAKAFYEKLYTSTNDAPFNITNTGSATVGNELNDAYFTQEELSISEIGLALARFPPNKTPGCDGLSAEFYKFFWSRLKFPLLAYYNEAFHTSELGWSARRGVLSLIPKKRERHC